jgi:hypothetical protein
MMLEATVTPSRPGHPMIPRRLPTLLTPLLLGLTLACTKSRDTDDDSQVKDSPSEDSASGVDTEPPEPQVKLGLYTSIALGGYSFQSTENVGISIYLPVAADTQLVYPNKPGTWWPVVISPDETACHQGETALVNDGERYDWTFDELPGVFTAEGFTCVMP